MRQKFTVPQSIHIQLLMGLFCLFLAQLGACGSEQSLTDVTLSATTVTNSASITKANNISTATVKPVTTPTLNSPVSQDWQSNWLKGTPCRPPCWEGIIPGHTTVNEALELLKKNQLISGVEQFTSSFNVTVEGLRWNWATTSQSSSILGEGGLLYNDNVSKVIYSITPIYGETVFTFDQVIQQFGEPTYIIAQAQRQAEGNSISYYLNIIYVNQGFYVSNWSSSKNLGKPILKADMILNHGVSFFIPGPGYLNKVFPNATKYLISWQGFKTFDFYCRDTYGLGAEDCSKL
jgi:hypothetical protein